MDASRRIAELEGRLAGKQRRIAELEAELSARDARIAELERHVDRHGEQLAELSEKLGQTSANSNQPPSKDPPRTRAERRKKRNKGKRRRGGQPGHKGSRRTLLPPEQVDEVVDFFPPQCENCWEQLPQTPDPGAKRYQSTELPPVTPHTTEYRRHAVVCPCCDYTTRAAYEEQAIPASPFGPRLMAVVALLTGAYHLSRRKTAELLADLLGVQMSLGAISAVEARVSDAVEPAVDEAWEQVGRAGIKHADGTSWLQGGVSKSLWTIATALATVFKIVPSSSKEALRSLFVEMRGILISDRDKALSFWAMDKRQICWAHLLRKFIGFAERDGPAATIGRELLDYAGVIFEYWDDYKTGKLTRKGFVDAMAPVRPQFEKLLERAVAADIPRLSGSCADMLEHRAALWTFVDRKGVEPTNNHAERELRTFVLWRKRSFGTQSERGNLFAERLMTVVHTARKQGIHVLGFLTACCAAWRSSKSRPSLLEPEATAA